jgi:leucine dehydrogenase
MTYKCGCEHSAWWREECDPRATERLRPARRASAHGRAVESLNGRYVTSVDIGTGPEDMVIVRETTTRVTGLPNELGDPSPVTARGVVCAIEAAQYVRTSSRDLHGVRVAVQGCGHVGNALALQLYALGARLIVCDASQDRATAVAAQCESDVLPPDDIYEAQADVYAPCATGATLNPRTIPRLRVRAAGRRQQSAGNKPGRRRAARGGITYAGFRRKRGRGDLSVPGARGLDRCSDERRWSRFSTRRWRFSIARRTRISAQDAAERVVDARLSF